MEDSHLLRFNKRSGMVDDDGEEELELPQMRYHRQSDDHLLRFNRNARMPEEVDSSKRATDDHLLRFARQLSDEHLLRPSKRSTAHGRDAAASRNARYVRQDAHLLRFN